MTFDKSAILYLFKDFYVDYDVYDNMFCFTSEDNYTLKNYLKNLKNFDNFYLDNGASKCVIIPTFADYVIKLPYTGEYFEADEMEGETEPYYQSFTEAADHAEGWDYCQVEYLHYQIAKAAGMDQYLAPTLFLGNMAGSGFPVYIQPKCKIFSHTTSHHSHEERESTRKTLISNGILRFHVLPIDWMIDFQNVYGESELINFINFLENEGWGDLRADNVGYLNGKPVLVDYSDFYG